MPNPPTDTATTQMGGTESSQPPPEIIDAARHLRAWALDDIRRGVEDARDRRRYVFERPARLVDELTHFLDVYAPAD